MTRSAPLAFGFILLVTLVRLIALWFDKTDLFVDESQYWLWGQDLDFGYYSKPPLIAWILRLVTELTGSVDSFWVRFPAPIFHAATASVLFFFSRQLFDERAAFWVAVTYITLPMTSLGSYLISTDTIMLPFFALGLWAYVHAIKTKTLLFAGLAGLAIGVGFMAKYAAVYFLMGAGLAAIFVPTMRPSIKQTVLFMLAFAVVISPNVIWNIQNDLTTVSHTMENVNWVKEDVGLSLNYTGMLEFFTSQLLVFGPVLFIVLIIAIWRPIYPEYRLLAWHSWPIIALVVIQALLARAYANWAVAAYIAGSLLVVVWLLDKRPVWLRVSLVINAAIALLLPILIVMGPIAAIKGKPILARYLGRTDVSDQIMARAIDQNATAIVSDSRAMMADLFVQNFKGEMVLFSRAYDRPPRSYYEQVFSIPANHPSPVLFASIGTPPGCAIHSEPLNTGVGAFANKPAYTALVTTKCLAME